MRVLSKMISLRLVCFRFLVYFCALWGSYLRTQEMARLENHQGSVMNLADNPDIDNILEIMFQIRTINEIALKANYLYEEFLLFGIYPNGGLVYQKVRDVMEFTQDASSISVGLEPLESNWTLNLNPKKESNSKAAN